MRSFNRVFPAKAFKMHWDEMKSVMHEIDDANKQVHVLIEAEKRKRSTGYKSQNHHLNGHTRIYLAYTAAGKDGLNAVKFADKEFSSGIFDFFSLRHGFNEFFNFKLHGADDTDRSFTHAVPSSHFCNI